MPAIQLPSAFQEQIQALLPDRWQSFLDAIGQPALTSIRLNPDKAQTPDWKGRQVPWCEFGMELTERPSFIADPLHHAGAYYVQESSSMFLGQVLNHLLPEMPEQPLVLDLCAAPGGKSTHILQALNGKGLLVSNEVIKSRVKILSENLDRWGAFNKMVTSADPRQFSKLESLFDLVVVDAPCSGEGMFRKNPLAANEWSREAVIHCSLRQARILEDVLPGIKPGGYLVYSTCTFNETENEASVARIRDQFGLEPVRIPIREDWGIVETQTFGGSPLFGYRFYPDRVRGEGFFLSCLRKPGTPEQSSFSPPKNVLNPAEINSLNAWVNHPEAMVWMKREQTIHAVPAGFSGLVAKLDKHLDTVWPGTPAGELIRNELIPHQALATSHLPGSAVTRQELSLTAARAFLRKDTLSRNDFNQPGWNLVTFKQLGLGWVKVLPNRVNNYFPAHLRVLKQINDETP